MKYVSTIGLHSWPNTFSRFTVPILQARPCSIGNCVAAKCCASSKNCLHVWLAWRHAVALTIGRARSRTSAMMCASFHQPTSNLSSSAVRRTRPMRKPSARR